MSERDALLLGYPMDDDDLLAINSTHSKTHRRSGRRSSGNMSLQTLHAAQSSTDEDMADGGGLSHSNATSRSSSEYVSRLGHLVHLNCFETFLKLCR